MRRSAAARRRAMYAGGRPDAEARAIHRRFVDGPIPRLVPIAAVLEVAGRRTGETTRVPIVVVRYRRHRYVVSMLGENVNWVRNVRTAGGDAVLVQRRRCEVRLVEVAPGGRAPILRRYVLIALGARPHMPVTWRSGRAEFEAIAASYPVFEVIARH